MGWVVVCRNASVNFQVLCQSREEQDGLPGRKRQCRGRERGKESENEDVSERVSKVIVRQRRISA